MKEKSTAESTLDVIAFPGVSIAMHVPTSLFPNAVVLACNTVPEGVGPRLKLEAPWVQALYSQKLLAWPGVRFQIQSTLNVCKKATTNAYGIRPLLRVEQSFVCKGPVLVGSSHG